VEIGFHPIPTEKPMGIPTEAPNPTYGNPVHGNSHTHGSAAEQTRSDGFSAAKFPYHKKRVGKQKPVRGKFPHGFYPSSNATAPISVASNILQSYD